MSIRNLTTNQLMELLYKHSSELELNKKDPKKVRYYTSLIAGDMAEIQERKGWGKNYSINQV